MKEDNITSDKLSSIVTLVLQSDYIKITIKFIHTLLCCYLPGYMGATEPDATVARSEQGGEWGRYRKWGH